MNREETLKGEIRAMRERLTRLSQASVRINESLDFNVVLQEVIDSACYLANARYGVIATTDAAGGLDAVLTSGTSDDEHRQIVSHPDGQRIFEHFRRLPGAIRVGNYFQYATSASLDGRLPMRVWSGLAAPILHRGESAGIIYLGHDREEKEFSEEDEEILVMFAAHAALVIANARRYRDEQRTRTDLETLISTCPVGVAVFDAGTGEPLSFNREAVRIMDGLCAPGEPPEHLLETLTVRRADGREVSLDEVPIAQMMVSGETVRAEELYFQVPDGRNLTALVNATPTHSGTGEVETYVVTVQDMSPLEELERMRAEFLARVSHELRTPLAAVRGSASTLLNESTDLHPAEIGQFHQIILEQSERIRALIADLLDVAHIETGSLPIAPVPTDLAALLAELEQRFRAGDSRHDLLTEVHPDLPLVMADRSRIAQVIDTLLTNSVRHSPQSSTIRIGAAPGDLHVLVSVADEGTGIAGESLPHLFRKFSLTRGEKQMPDTGLSLAVCKGIVEAHGGRIWAESSGPGLGASFTFTLPTVNEPRLFAPTQIPETSHRPARGSDREPVRILAVDSDNQALRYVRDALVKSGYEVVATGDPHNALLLAEEHSPHLALLDLMLSGTDGTELMKRIKEFSDIPVIFVSAYGQDQLVARAFELGADDYVVKPFSPTEIVARIKAALQRRTTAVSPFPYKAGALVIDHAERVVSLEGEPVELTPKQYQLLAELSANPGRILTYQHLLRRVWGSSGDADIRPMRTAISAIRNKLGDDADNPKYIFTKPRVGYSMPRADAP